MKTKSKVWIAVIVVVFALAVLINLKLGNTQSFLGYIAEQTHLNLIFG